MDEDVCRLLEAMEKKFDTLREADREAVKLAHADLSHRLEGFPQQFATKQEMENATNALQRLEKDSISREIYEQNHRALADLVARLDRDKMPEAVFQAFIDNYRIEQENAAVERRAVASALAASSSHQLGSSATWGRIAAVVIGATAVITALVGAVVVLANYLSGV